MSIEKSKVTDLASASITRVPSLNTFAAACGRFKLECLSAAGDVKWAIENDNLVVNGGLQYMCGTGLTGTTAITAWYIGLYGAGASNTPAATDTMASHAGWTEVVPYSNATRGAITFVAATNANPSVATNSTAVAFTINGTATIGGAFLTSGSAKSGVVGTLFSAVDFSSPGDRAVVSGDTLNVTYTFSLTG